MDLTYRRAPTGEVDHESSNLRLAKNVFGVALCDDRRGIGGTSPKMSA
jgi:hypothetical protein